MLERFEVGSLWSGYACQSPDAVIPVQSVGEALSRHTYFMNSRNEV